MVKCSQIHQRGACRAVAEVSKCAATIAIPNEATIAAMTLAQLRNPNRPQPISAQTIPTAMVAYGPVDFIARNNVTSASFRSYVPGT